MEITSILSPLFMNLVRRLGFFLQQKLDAFEIFKICKAYVKRQSRHTNKILRTNRGTKYTICDDFLKKNGI